ncbi:MAG: acylphosphatase [Selenomonadaceae bacterium]|nr:acylphosphatase [Selenomonadaceae bacterium]
MAETVRYYGVASGRVQGVGFRFTVQSYAQELNMTGWVRNMPDGTVTMEFQGTQAEADRLIAQIREGNFFIKVEKLKLESREPLPQEDGFVIRY